MRAYSLLREQCFDCRLSTDIQSVSRFVCYVAFQLCTGLFPESIFGSARNNQSLHVRYSYLNIKNIEILADLWSDMPSRVRNSNQASFKESRLD